MNNIKQIITGKTGCGKTYHTLHMARDFGNFIYLAPCRQLVYEIYIDYSLEGDALSTGEVKIESEKENWQASLFAVYETAKDYDFKKYKSIIIDEAHFITDPDRGGNLKKIIKKSKEAGLNIFLVTATKNFRKLNGFELVELKSKFKTPKFVQIDEKQFYKNVEAGMPSINFCRYKSNALLSMDTPPSARLQLQLNFRSGKIKYISATNVLAQGINMPASNILIEHNPYDGEEILMQKIGRLGRTGFFEGDEVYYALHIKKEKIKIKNKKITHKKRKTIKIYGEKLELHEIPRDLMWVTDWVKPIKWRWKDEKEIKREVGYTDIKYSLTFIKKHFEKFPNYIQNALFQPLVFAEIEERKIKKIILENLKK